MMLYPDKPVLWLNHSFKLPWRVIQSWNRLVRVKCSLFVFSLTQFIEVKLSSKCSSDRTEESSVWQALRCETQSNREAMHPRWFFHLYILSSATTALSALCQGRLIYILYILQGSASDTISCWCIPPNCLHLPSAFCKLPSFIYEI